MDCQLCSSQRPAQNLWRVSGKICPNFNEFSVYLRKLTYGSFLLSIFTWFLQFSSLKYRVWWNGFFPSLNWIFLPAVACKILKLTKNPVHKTQYFKLENCKNQVQINRGRIWVSTYFRTSIKMFSQEIKTNFAKELFYIFAGFILVP